MYDQSLCRQEGEKSYITFHIFGAKTIFEYFFPPRKMAETKPIMLVKGHIFQ
jgi:hypothetical protein